MNFSKVSNVARFEFWSTVKRKAYLITTFGMPVFILAYAGIIGLVAKTADSEESKIRVYGVIDHAQILQLGEDDLQAPDNVSPEVRKALDSMKSVPNPGAQMAISVLGRSVFRGYDTLETALVDLGNNDLKGIYVIPQDFLESGEVEIYRSPKISMSSGGSRRALETLMQNKLLEGKIDESLFERVRDPISESVQWSLTKEGEIEPYDKVSAILKFVIPIVFMFLLFISLMMSASYLVQGTATEKENKVVEVLLASAEPDEILSGKLLGLGAAGLIQVCVWFSMVIVGASVSAVAFSIAGFAVPWGSIVLGAFLFILAYLFLGSLMLGTGSLGSNIRESQQYSMVWSMLSMMPMIFMGALITQPAGMPAKILTWIPFSAPTMLIFRTSIDPEGIAWWEIVGPILLLMLCTWGAIRLGSRLFRVGLLLGGSKPKWREIWRQARLSS